MIVKSHVSVIISLEITPPHPLLNMWNSQSARKCGDS